MVINKPAKDLIWPEDFINHLVRGDCLPILKQIPDNSIQCCVTSPPYWGLRDYGYPEQIGLEKTPEEYVEKLKIIFHEVNRVLRKDGTLWLNLGDSYVGSWGNSGSREGGQRAKNALKYERKAYDDFTERPPSSFHLPGLKPKDLVGIPWRVAFALQADGWYLRSDIIWCLSGGTYVYARTQKGDMPMMIRDMARLKPWTVQLWNGKKWTRLLGVNKSKRTGKEIEIVLRSGERISCSLTHKFPTKRGLLEAGDIKIGDILKRVSLPQPENPKDCVLDEDAAWFAGLYLAEGSRSGDTIQIAGHVKEKQRWIALQKIVNKFGGSITRTINGNKMDIRIYGKILNAIIDELITGRASKNKGFAPVVWRFSNCFIDRMLAGYIAGDGHWEEKNHRWRLGFTRNYNLERDLRAACARLGYHLTINLSKSNIGDNQYLSFRGEMRFAKSSHCNNKSKEEVVEIRKARCRELYDIGVADDPYIFALSSGILTHNSKPNPMPESVKDRPTKSHEYMFLMTKSEKYYYDAEAIKEKAKPDNSIRDRDNTKLNNTPGRTKMGGLKVNNYEYKNKRSVWTVATKPYKGAHFATFPPKLITPCILAGSRQGDIILDPFGGAGTTAMTARTLGRHFIHLDMGFCDQACRRINSVPEFLL